MLENMEFNFSFANFVVNSLSKFGKFLLYLLFVLIITFLFAKLLKLYIDIIENIVDDVLFKKFGIDSERDNKDRTLVFYTTGLVCLFPILLIIVLPIFYSCERKRMKRWLRKIKRKFKKNKIRVK